MTGADTLLPLLCVCVSRQSRNRYKSSAIALSVAKRYAELELPVGVIVIDYKNQHQDVSNFHLYCSPIYVPLCCAHASAPDADFATGRLRPEPRLLPVSQGTL